MSATAFAAALAVARGPELGLRVAETLQQLKRYPAHAELARDPIQRAEHALRRARDARAAGSHEHAAALESLADEWANTGRDLVRASEVERTASRAETEASELETRLIRARALIEETVARRGRAAELLEQLESNAAAGGAAEAAAAGGASGRANAAQTGKKASGAGGGPSVSPAAPNAGGAPGASGGAANR